MKELSLNQIAAWCGLNTRDRWEPIRVTGVQFDSRRIKPGDLFVALIGERADGHDFLREAENQGAVAALVSRPSAEARIPCLRVEDTMKAYGAIAAGYRQLLNFKTIGITGSVGKTTTKEMTAAILKTSFRVAKTKGNHNNNLGLPMSILDAEESTEVAVLEMGMNHFGEMAYLTGIARPNVALITNIGTMHIEHLGSRDGILQAKMEIMQGMPEDGIGVFNGDEPLLWNIREVGSHQKYYFGIENKACDVIADDIQELSEGMRFRITGLGHQFEAFVPVIGHHAVYNSLAATTAALLMGVKPEKIQVALSNFQNTGMRQRIYQKNDVTIIEDCYNAGPESMEAALQVLESYPADGRKIAVLGDMLELGNRSTAEHYRIGRMVVGKADMLYTYGSHSERMVIGAITGGMPSKNTEHFTTHEDLAKLLKSRARPGDVLLFKGSRGMKMECVLQMFLQENQ